MPKGRRAASINADTANSKGRAASINADTANTKGSTASINADTANTKGSAASINEEDTWLVLYSVNRGVAKGMRGVLHKNPPIDTIARKDPPKGLLNVTRNNPPMDVMAREDLPEEGAAVSVAAVAKIPDKKQYPAVQCTMAQDMCMYGKSASLGVESMNQANKIFHDKMAVDMLNAAILLLQMEGNHFYQWKEKAWGRELPLTPKGMEHMEMVFKDVNVHEYRLTTHEDMFWHYATISKNTEKAREYHVRLPKESYKGFYFGQCTCGVTSKEGLSCRHMVVLVKSSVIPALT